MQGQVATGQQDVVTGVCTRGGKGLVERDIIDPTVLGKTREKNNKRNFYAMDASLGARSHLLSHNADTTTDSRRTCTRCHHFCILYRVKREIEKKRDAIFIFMRAYVWCEGSSATYLPGLASRPPPWDSARRITRRTRMCEQIVRGLAEG